MQFLNSKELEDPLRNIKTLNYLTFCRAQGEAPTIKKVRGKHLKVYQVLKGQM